MLQYLECILQCIWQFNEISVRLYFLLFVVLYVDYTLGSKTSSCFLHLLPL